MAYTAEQRAVANAAIREARRQGASPREIKALIESGIVESNLQHGRYSKVGSGDRDSVGFLQQRPSQGWGPAGESIEQDTRQFLKVAQQINRKGFSGSAGELAAQVQRPAAEYRGRYHGVSAQADALLDGAGLAGSPSGSTRRKPLAGGSTRTVTTTTPGTDNSAARAQLVSQFLGTPGKPDVLGFAAGIKSLRDTPGTSSSTTSRTPGSAAASPAAQPTGRTQPGGRAVPRSTPRNVVDFNVLPIARSLGMDVTSGSVAAANRRHGPTVSGGRSDHQGGGRDTWAADMSNGSQPTPQMDKLAARIAKQYGIPWSGSGAVSKVVNSGGRRYRLQLIYRSNVGGDHYNHVHFGVKAL